MQRQQQAILPGETARGIFPRRAGAPVAAPAPAGRAQSRTSIAPAPAAAAPAKSAPLKDASRPLAASLQHLMEHDYAGATPVVNMSDYLMGTLAQFKDDPEVLNPSGARIQSAEAGVESSAESRELDQLVTRVGAIMPSWPFGHAAISDTRVYFDTLALPSTHTGSTSGEVQVRFADLNSTSPPVRVVKMILSPFQFPHIYTASSAIFDLFYFGTVFMTIRSIPNIQLTQTHESDMQFAFELRVDNPDSNSLYLTPLEPVFCLGKPMSLLSDLAVQFRVKSPSGSFVNCPLPPIRVRARRTAAPIGGPTTFNFVDPIYIGALAPPGATYQVAVLFTDLQATLAPNALIAGGITNPIGFFAQTFTQVGATAGFDIVWDSSAIPFPVPGVDSAARDDIWLFIPKNSISFTMRFSSLSPSATNELFPLHV